MWRPSRSHFISMLALVWLGVVFFWLSQPPKSPPPFPSTGDNLIPSRSIYNPILAASLDQGLRDYWQKPGQVLAELGDLSGQHVADIGCGEGYFTLPLLELTRPDGEVLATDIQPELLAALSEKVPPEQRQRIRLIQSQPKDIGIREKVDWILVVQVLAEVEDQRAFLLQLRGIMDDHAKLAIIDSKHFTDPTTGYTRPLSLQKLKEDFETLGFRLVAQIDLLPKQFFFILAKGPVQKTG